MHDGQCTRKWNIVRKFSQQSVQRTNRRVILTSFWFYRGKLTPRFYRYHSNAATPHSLLLAILALSFDAKDSYYPPNVISNHPNYRESLTVRPDALDASIGNRRRLWYIDQMRCIYDFASFLIISNCKRESPSWRNRFTSLLYAIQSESIDRRYTWRFFLDMLQAYHPPRCIS